MTRLFGPLTDGSPYAVQNSSKPAIRGSFVSDSSRDCAIVQGIFYLAIHQLIYYHLLMAYDYNKLYGEIRDALGPPTEIFLKFFNQLGQQHLRVLDVGCGQGRDALFIARKGFSVVGVEISTNGIRDLEDAAKKENLPIEGVIADITTYRPTGVFDVILIDRTLHMLARPSRLAVLETLLDHVAPNGWLLIADEVSNIGDFKAVCSAHVANWADVLESRGYLFLRRS